jgi:hypothetical protein
MRPTTATTSSTTYQCLLSWNIHEVTIRFDANPFHLLRERERESCRRERERVVGERERESCRREREREL